MRATMTMRAIFHKVRLVRTPSPKRTEEKENGKRLATSSVRKIPSERVEGKRIQRAAGKAEHGKIKSEAKEEVGFAARRRNGAS